MDSRTLSYINLYAVLGSLGQLCALQPDAKKLIENENTVLGFDVSGGPKGRLIFKNGICSFADGADPCSIKLKFSSCEKFNGMIDGTVTPIPCKGFTKIGFLLKKFVPLTDILTKYLRPEKELLKDEAFFNISTTVMFHLIVSAIAQIGNNDAIGRFSAGNVVDGNIRISVCGGPVGYISVHGSHMEAHHEDTDDIMSYMEFADMATARDLFDGNINAVCAVGQGKVRIGGMISQVDNINRILDRVAVYLA